MFSARKTITIPFDFTTRFVNNFVYAITGLKSNPYFITTDRNINAKSILGIISANIKKDDMVVVAMYGSSQEQADDDLEKFIEIISEVGCGDGE